MTNTNNTESMATNTENIPVGTRVTMTIGSDDYAGTVVKSTKRTCVVQYDTREGCRSPNLNTFRLTTPDAKYYTRRTHYYLSRIGEAVTKMDPSF